MARKCQQSQLEKMRMNSRKSTECKARSNNSEYNAGRLYTAQDSRQ